MKNPMISREVRILLKRSKTYLDLIQLHNLILKISLDHNTSFISQYILSASSIRLEFARSIFDKSPITPPLFAWNTIIRAYTNSSTPIESVKLFAKLLNVGIVPDNFTYPFVIKACGCCLMAGEGGAVHSMVLKVGFDSDRYIGNTLLRMYGACGVIEFARRVFDEMTERDVVSWSSMIAGYVSWCGHIEEASEVFNSMNEKNLQSWTIMITCLADHGHGEHVLTLLNQLKETGVKFDSLSFSAILSACSHLGLVDMGRMYFDRMVRIYKIIPTIQHYGCIVDLLGRAGFVEEAYKTIKSMPMEPNSVILRSFISAIKNHGWDFRKDEKLSKLLLKIEPDLGANYVIAANLYSISGCWKDAAGLRVAMKEKGLKKATGWSLAKVNG